MTLNYFFTPGPSQLYPSVSKHIETALFENVPSISHRSKAFQKIYQETDESLKQLVGIPPDFAILFTSSATEIWQLILLNCITQNSFHFVNGAFSQRFFDFAKVLKKEAKHFQVEKGEGFELDKVENYIESNIEHMAFTHNETSTGVTTPEHFIHQVAEKYPNAIHTVDMVSSVPYPKLNYNLVDSAYFSVQKAFGLPAGLGVWIVNKRCLEIAEKMEKEGRLTGTYHRLTNLWKSYEKYQTPATPNMLTIYLLGKVVQDMLTVGVEKIREQTEQKAQILYQFLEASSIFQPFVTNEEFRSPTVIVANSQSPTSEINQHLLQKGMVVGDGYKELKGKQIRIANFPAFTLAQVEELIQNLKTFEPNLNS